MRTYTKITLLLMLFLAEKSIAQVGINATGIVPDAKAMLDISSTSKGLLIPRMTLAQRNAISSAPGVTPEGLTIFDTDTKNLWIFKYAAWYAFLPSPWEVSGTDIFNNNSGNVGIGTLPSSSAKLDILGRMRSVTNTPTGLSNYFYISNSENPNPTLVSITGGLGSAGEFQNSNTSNTAATILGINSGLGRAGVFRIFNASNSDAALYSSSNGTGETFYGDMVGLGKAAVFDINNATNNNIVLTATTNGKGQAGNFIINNVTNNTAALVGISNGTGQAIYGVMTGAGKNVVFETNNVTNSNPGLTVFTNGLGSAGEFKNTNTSNTATTISGINSGLGYAGEFENINATNSQPTIKSSNNGLGSAGVFAIDNFSNHNIAIRSYTVGTNSAGNFLINNAINNFAALVGISNGTGQAVKGTMTGTGKAAVFEINNPSNSNPALTAIITTGTGTAAYFQGTKALETSGTVKFGGPGVGTIAAGKVLTATDALGNATWQNVPNPASDRRLKKNITPIAYGLNEVMQLQPVNYQMKADDVRQVGFIAQDVQKLLPEVVTGKEGDLSKGENLAIAYGNMTAILTKAIQEQQLMIDQLKMEIAALKTTKK